MKRVIVLGLGIGAVLSGCVTFYLLSALADVAVNLSARVDQLDYRMQVAEGQITALQNDNEDALAVHLPIADGPRALTVHAVSDPSPELGPPLWIESVSRIPATTFAASR